MGFRFVCPWNLLDFAQVSVHGFIQMYTCAHSRHKQSKVLPCFVDRACSCEIGQYENSKRGCASLPGRP